MGSTGRLYTRKRTGLCTHISNRSRNCFIQWNYTDIFSFMFPVSLLTELNVTWNLGKQCVISSRTDVCTCMESWADLTYKYIACFNKFSAKSFHAPSLTLGISSIATASGCFFMCHNYIYEVGCSSSVFFVTDFLAEVFFAVGFFDVVLFAEVFGY